jgi:hypothetical protein
MPMNNSTPVMVSTYVCENLVRYTKIEILEAGPGQGQARRCLQYFGGPAIDGRSDLEDF